MIDLSVYEAKVTVIVSLEDLPVPPGDAVSGVKVPTVKVKVSVIKDEV